jgi:2'-5' RNA ligase
MEELFDRWDVAAGQSNGGMPMHVTLMAPFVDSDDFDDETILRLKRIMAPTSPFECSLTEVRTFLGPPQRAWHAPEPVDRFISMTEAVMAEFPGLLPYGGEHDGIVPHVSVAKQRDTYFAAAISGSRQSSGSSRDHRGRDIRIGLRPMG